MLNDKRVPLALAICITLSILGIGVARRFTTDTADFVELAGVLLAFVASSMAVLVSLVVLNSQDKTVKQIELVKSDLEKGFEYFKQRQNAYRELFGASLVLYYALRELEIGSYRRDLVEEAKETMIKACFQLLYVSSEDETCWMRFWQEAINIEGQAKSATSADECKRIWEEHVGRIAPLARRFQKAARKAVSDGPG